MTGIKNGKSGNRGKWVTSQRLSTCYVKHVTVQQEKALRRKLRRKRHWEGKKPFEPAGLHDFSAQKEKGSVSEWEWFALGRLLTRYKANPLAHKNV